MSLAQVTEFPLITQSPADITRALLSHALEHARLSVDFVAEVDDVPSLISAIRAGLGGAVLPTANLSTIGGDDLPRPVLIEPPLQLTASIISDSDTPLTRAGDAVRVLLAPLIRRYLDESLPGTEWIGP
jgi:LysR family nitrogen assimilation transcriptional regulator